MQADGVWFIYALGSGWGHLNRALALARVGAKRHSVHVLTNSPYAERIVGEQCESVQSGRLTLHLLPEADSLTDAKQAIFRVVRSVEYDCLVVDTFPRGLLGELALLIPDQPDICRVLVHRDITPDYIVAKNIDAFVQQYYDGILIPGEQTVPFADFSQARCTAPWLSRHAAELFAHPLPEWNIQQPLIVVCAAGNPEELTLFGEITTRLSAIFPNATVRCLSATCPERCSSTLWLSHWPGMDVLQFAQVVIGSGGYNLVHECAALEVPLLAFALPRRYDRQTKRIRQHARLVATIDEAIASVGALLNQVNRESAREVSGRTPGYENGVDSAIAAIENWQRSKWRVQ